MTFPIVTELPPSPEPLGPDPFVRTAVGPSDAAPLSPPPGRRIVD